MIKNGMFMMAHQKSQVQMVFGNYEITIRILASKSIEITNNMILKSGNTTFRATIN
jgi:hypothetical protein